MKKNWEEFWKGKNTKMTWSKRRVIKAIGKYARGKILDAGCGSGFYSKYFVDRGCNVTALDYSQKALEMTTNLDKRIKIKEGNVLHMPFAHSSFDLVFSDGLLEHFKKPQMVLKEFKRVLKVGGRVVTIVPNKFSYWIIAKPFLMKDIDEYRFDLKEAIRLHKEAGFKITGFGGISVLPIKYSPEFLGKFAGRLLYVVGEKYVAGEKK